MESQILKKNLMEQFRKAKVLATREYFVPIIGRFVFFSVNGLTIESLISKVSYSEELPRIVLPFLGLLLIMFGLAVIQESVVLMGRIGLLNREQQKCSFRLMRYIVGVWFFIYPIFGYMYLDLLSPESTRFLHDSRKIGR